MPFKNEHAARMIEPTKFNPSTFRRKKLTDGISAIFGFLKSDKDNKTMKLQTYRFDKDKFTVKEAKKWLKEHDATPIKFEEATINECITFDMIFENALVGNVSDNLGEAEIAELHGVSVEHIQKQLEDGIKIEMEHTNDPIIAKRIALDHLFETPYYYTELVKMNDKLGID